MPTGNVKYPSTNGAVQPIGCIAFPSTHGVVIPTGNVLTTSSNGTVIPAGGVTVSTANGGILCICGRPTVVPCLIPHTTANYTVIVRHCVDTATFASPANDCANHAAGNAVRSIAAQQIRRTSRLNPHRLLVVHFHHQRLIVCGSQKITGWICPAVPRQSPAAAADQCTRTGRVHHSIGIHHQHSRRI